MKFRGEKGHIADSAWRRRRYAQGSLQWPWILYRWCFSTEILRDITAPGVTRIKLARPPQTNNVDKFIASLRQRIFSHRRPETYAFNNIIVRGGKPFLVHKCYAETQRKSFPILLLLLFHFIILTRVYYNINTYLYIYIICTKL